MIPVSPQHFGRQDYVLCYKDTFSNSDGWSFPMNLLYFLFTLQKGLGRGENFFDSHLLRKSAKAYFISYLKLSGFS